ncbi:ADP-ribose pyrophosphatase [Anaerolinea thermolimosa]|uniref:NUDIX hydrolase n=1 Tax=Anaerolinea thermolimosa TaxID=229919 RepID=UPI000780794A|nr:NUDIX hydrolase [Anaerolinea thermolimosa]GAP07555.1 ADP-ribose pyrophosphatase [Anaerolinea thermolimosa]
MIPWKTLQIQPVFSSDRWLTVEDRTVQTPDGQVIEHWPWVITPDYINVLAVTPDGRYLVFRQGKYGLEGDSLAPVGGYLEPGEDPLAAAQRELLEETGYTARQWHHLGHFLVDPNRGVARGDLFLASDAFQVAQPVPDDLEEQELLLLSRAELETALRRGQFKVLAWAATVAFALLSNPQDEQSFTTSPG